MLQILQNVANVAEFFKKRLPNDAKSLKNVTNVAKHTKCFKCCRSSKCCKRLTAFKNVAYAVELSKRCRDINKCCKCVGFLKTQGDFALLHLCLELIKTICNLLCSLCISRFAFAAVLTIRGGSLSCYVDTAEMLAFRESDKCFFCPNQH